MPTIGGRNFPYTSEGMRAANLYQQQLAQNPGTRGGGLPGYMGFRPLGMQRGGKIELPRNKLKKEKEYSTGYQMLMGNPPKAAALDWFRNASPRTQDAVIAEILERLAVQNQANVDRASEQRRRGSLPSSVGLGQPPFSAEAEGRTPGQQEFVPYQWPTVEEPTDNLGRMRSPVTGSVPAKEYPLPAGLRDGGMLPRRRRY